MSDLSLGVALWSQSSDWPRFLAAAQLVDRLGYDHVWTWDHIYAIFGDENQSIFEGLYRACRDGHGDRTHPAGTVRGS